MKRNGWRLYSYMGVWWRARGEQFDYLDVDGWEASNGRMRKVVTKFGLEH